MEQKKGWPWLGWEVWYRLRERTARLYLPLVPALRENHIEWMEKEVDRAVICLRLLDEFLMQMAFAKIPNSTQTLALRLNPRAITRQLHSVLIHN